MSAQKDTRTIRLDDDADRMRYICPNGHRSWEPTNNHFWCKACSQSHDDDINPEFEELVDARDGDRLSRKQIKLQTAVGSYKDLYKGERA